MGIRTFIKNWLKIESKITPPKTLTVGKGSYVSTIHSYFDAVVTIGNYCSIGTPLYVHGASEHSWVFDRKLVSTYPFGPKGERDHSKRNTKGPIIIGSDVWIGHNVTIMSGVQIGDGAIIGANAVVAKNIPPFAIAVGNPVKVIKYRYNDAIIKNLLKIKWWDWPEEKIVNNLVYFQDIDKFIQKFS